MRIAVTLALLGTLLYPACSTTATANAPQPESLAYETMEGLLGFAHWDCTEPYPVAWVRVHFRGKDLAYFQGRGLWATPGFKETVAHELQHIEQAHRAGGCEPWKEALRDPAFRQRMEEEATCVGMAIGRGLPCDEP